MELNGLLDGSKLGCSVGRSDGHMEGVVVGALKGLSATKDMLNMR